MGQFEYAVGLSPVGPADIERIAKEYLEKREKMKLIPLEDKVIVKPIKDEKASSSGLIIASINDEKPSMGIVEAVGPGMVFGNGQRLTIDLKIGDKVHYSKFAGTEFEDYVILPYREILAVVG